MSNSEALTDEYLAELMDKEAKRSLKYSGMGFEGDLTTSKPPSNKPKPNTRFLTNIIKDTTNHNQALLAKEAAESRARLQSLATAERRGEKSRVVGGGDIRKRQLGDIAAILGNGGRRAKRPRSRGGEKEGTGRSDGAGGDEEPSPKKSRQGSRRFRDEGREEDIAPKRNRRDDCRLQAQSIGDESEKDAVEKRHSKEYWKRRHPSQEDRSDEEDSKRRSKSERRGRHKSLEEDEEPKISAEGASKRKHRSRDTDSEEEEESRSHRHRHRRHRSRSTSKDREQRRRHRSRSRSPREHRDKESRHGNRSSRKRSRSPRRPQKESPLPTKRKEQTDYDSDPLESIIGPAPPPPVRSRGRGTFSHLSGGIDSRFSADYDPTADVHLDVDEENDWDQALEALRDRQKWKQQGADRLRAAGFTEDEIGKWEKGGEKREEDVRWAKKGEGREWDRGKIVDDETGGVSIEPMFGRLKDS
ncbi:hypothetical protein LHYA1_G001616 [Lachnellula hyalina]|uniref:Pre-mRNA-splicing factor 38B n=1 Tax=Lachnellula hyalina TaxID=1316788 RepID=A0A8H8RBL6_9HELO|nr:uncharacterized protein LHYA1_G001616 [Lachnellula hyalina]TVY30351.1 hypothetical protein LHYA1_G001616 [Lachnellula hyalina]